MSEFLNSSREVVKNFLQNVVIIDDELEFEEKRELTEKIPKKEGDKLNKAAAKTMRRTKTLETPNEELKITEEKAKPEQEDDAKSDNKGKNTHPINAQKLINQFSKNGLLCSFIKPSSTSEENLKLYGKSLKKADILILDWRLAQGDMGDSVKKFITNLICDEPEDFKKSMRYIAIYSGEENLNEKMAEIKQALNEINIKDELPKDDYKFKSGHLIISIFAKNNDKRITDIDIMKKEEELTETILDDFTIEFCGVIPNLALNSLANIRNNTHRLLTKFSKELDYGYLAHKAMLPEPKDAEELLINLISDEIQSILEDSNSELSGDDLKHWIEDNFESINQTVLYQTYKECYLNKKYYSSKDELEKKLSFCSKLTSTFEELYEKFDESVLMKFMKGNKENFTTRLKEDVHSCIIDGIENKKEHPAHNILKNDSSKFIKVLKNTKKPTDDLYRFAVLSTNKTFYSKPIPYLTLGSILKKEEKYYISLMPRCDAARIKASDNICFPMLPLSGEKDGEFEVIFNDGNATKRQQVNYTPKKLKTVVFKQKEGLQNSPIYAEKIEQENEKKYIFIDKNSSEEYEWVTELKKEKAQRISNEFSAKFSRVGFNESEYLRRGYQKTDRE